MLFLEGEDKTHLKEPAFFDEEKIIGEYAKN